MLQFLWTVIARGLIVRSYQKLGDSHLIKFSLTNRLRGRYKTSRASLFVSNTVQQTFPKCV